MATNSRFLPAALAAGVVAAGAFAATAAVAQSTPCGSPTIETLIDHSGETAVFTGIDQGDRAFTLTRNPETGAWALWAITEFTKETGGLEVGKPCVVIEGGESKLLSAPAEEQVAVTAEAPAEPAAAPADPDAETYRVAGIDPDEVLDLRAGPGTSNESIQKIPPDGTGIVVGSCQVVRGYRHPWCEVTWEGTKGWSSACCLEGEQTGRRPD